MLKPIFIGRHKIAHPVFLAPMSGISDLPFRQIAARCGAGLVFTEMVACQSLAAGNGQMRLRMQGRGVGLHAVQLAGREAYWMGEGARIAEAGGADILDINMGCPARKVTNGYSGSALMRDPYQALRLIEATVKAVRLPVCLKMRLGWDDAHITAPEIAKRAEDAGVQLITVHGRTRQQFFKGRADWRAIVKVSACVRIPVIANGDLTSLAEAGRMIAQSKASGLMIGRGAYGRPWLPGFIAGQVCAKGKPEALPGLEEKQKLVLEHYEAMLSYYGCAHGMRMARKHLKHYLDDIGCSDSGLRQQILTGERPKSVVKALKAAFLQASEPSSGSHNWRQAA